jgi:hypothetical protein
MIGVLRRRVMGGGSEEVDTIILTSTSNAPLMAICYAKGWAANKDYMMKSEAAAVADIETTFRSNTTVSTFNEFRYFTSVTSLAQRAFQECAITEITLPVTVASLGMYAFRKCASLQKLTINRTTPPTANSNAFGEMSGTVYVPASSVDTYKAASGWSSIASKIQAIPS